MLSPFKTLVAAVLIIGLASTLAYAQVRRRAKSVRNVYSIPKSFIEAWLIVDALAMLLIEQHYQFEVLDWKTWASTSLALTLVMGFGFLSRLHRWRIAPIQPSTIALTMALLLPQAFWLTVELNNYFSEQQTTQAVVRSTHDRGVYRRVSRQRIHIAVVDDWDRPGQQLSIALEKYRLPRIGSSIEVKYHAGLLGFRTLRIGKQ